MGACVFTISGLPFMVFPMRGLGLRCGTCNRLRLEAKPVTVRFFVFGWGFPHGIGFVYAEGERQAEAEHKETDSSVIPEWTGNRAGAIC